MEILFIHSKKKLTIFFLPSLYFSFTSLEVSLDLSHKSKLMQFQLFTGSSTLCGLANYTVISSTQRKVKSNKSYIGSFTFVTTIMWKLQK